MYIQDFFSSCNDRCLNAVAFHPGACNLWLDGILMDRPNGGRNFQKAPVGTCYAFIPNLISSSLLAVIKGSVVSI